MTDVYENINVELSEGEAVALPQTTDDLTKIKGIGSGTAEKLNVRKIYTYRQLAEITPEKLSEAHGIGIATARKFIEEAKILLGEFQEQNSEVDNIETYEIVEKVVFKNSGSIFSIISANFAFTSDIITRLFSELRSLKKLSAL